MNHPVLVWTLTLRRKERGEEGKKLGSNSRQLNYSGFWRGLSFIFCLEFTSCKVSHLDMQSDATHKHPSTSTPKHIAYSDIFLPVESVGRACYAPLEPCEMLEGNHSERYGKPYDITRERTYHTQQRTQSREFILDSNPVSGFHPQVLKWNFVVYVHGWQHPSPFRVVGFQWQLSWPSWCLLQLYGDKMYQCRTEARNPKVYRERVTG